MQKHTPVIVGVILAVLVASVLVDAQPVPGFSKTAPLAGTGSSGSPLRIIPCANGEIYQSNGSAWGCVVDARGDVTDVTAGIGLEGGASSGNATVSLLSSCSDGQVLKSASSGTSWVCANDIDTDSGGDITNVGVSAGGGLTGGGASGAVTLGLLTTCSSGQVLEWDGAAWACDDDDIGSPGAGDIESVAAGTGLTGGGTVGALTLDVGCGAGLSCGADTVTLALTPQNCAAGSFFDENTATGAFTCVAEVGDISSVVAGTGLTDGGTSGAVTLNIACGDGLSCAADEVRMRQDCSTGQVLKWTGTDWTCQSDSGSGAFDTAGNGLTSSGTTVNVVCGSNLACAADSVNLATNVDVGGTLDVTGNTTLDGTLAVIGNASFGGGLTYTNGAELNFYYGTNSTATGYLNYRGYAGGFGAFRNLIIGDGAAGAVATFTGATKTIDAWGPVNVAGNTALGDANTDTTSVFGKSYYLGTAPSLSGCAVCTIASYSTDARGKVTCTDGPVACTLTFSVAYSTNPPSCTLTGTTSTIPRQTSEPTTSAFTVTACAAGGCSFDYHCDGML